MIEHIKQRSIMIRNPQIRELSVSVTFTQEEDTSGRANYDYQDLKVDIIDMGSYDGSEQSLDDFYIVLKTERWAIDVNEIDAFANRLKELVATIVRIRS
jgi:hypothetical protein